MVASAASKRKAAIQQTGLVGTSILVAPVTLGHSADCCPYSRSGRSADKRSLQAAAEDRSEHRAARSPDQRSLARADAALIVLIAVVVVSTVVVSAVVVSPIVSTAGVASSARTLAKALVEVVIAIVALILGACRKKTHRKQERRS